MIKSLKNVKPNSLIYGVSLRKDIKMLEMISSLQGNIKVLLHKSLKLQFLPLLRRLLQCSGINHDDISPCNLYLIPTYSSSTLFECDSKNKRVRVQSDKAAAKA